jgi:hypothetical protein
LWKKERREDEHELQLVASSEPNLFDRLRRKDQGHGPVDGADRHAEKRV